MKILILGAGRVGESVAESLVSEKNDITVIDTDPARLGVLQDRLDLRGVAGNGIQPSVLQEAGIEDADMLIACAPHGRDQPRGLQGGARRVQRADHHRPHPQPRVRRRQSAAGQSDGFAVDQVICPEQSVTAYIRKLIEYPEALQVLEFARRPGQPDRGARRRRRAAGAAQPGRDSATGAGRRDAHRRHLPPGQGADATRRHARASSPATRSSCSPPPSTSAPCWARCARWTGRCSA